MARVSPTAAAFKDFSRLLHRRPHSISQLVEATGLRAVTICRWLETLHNGPENLVYIDYWKRSATVGPYTAYWAWGYCREDAPKPAKLTKQERNERARRRARISITTEGVISHVGN